MIDEDPRNVSRRLNRRHRDLNLSWSEKEREAIGSDTWVKLDTVTQRELAFQTRDEVVERMGGTGARNRDRRFRVMVNMRSGNRLRLASRPDTVKRRARRANLLRREGFLALKRLVPALATEGAEVLASYWLTHSALIEVDRSGLIAAAARDDVRSVNHDKPVLMTLLDSSRPVMGADQVENNLGFDGTGINVAVCDTGVDLTHASLAPVAGSQFDFTGEGTGDLHGHGTHCAGIVASNDAKRRGVAPGCTIHDYKHLDSSGGGQPSNGVSAIQQTVTDGMEVASHSWGASHANGLWVCAAGECVLCQAADAAVNAGQVFVVAAGNDNNDSCATYDTHIGCPGHASLAITVAASDDGDSMADFSSIGPAADGRAKPDVTAPGVDVVSARSSTGNDMNGEAPIVDDIWCEVSGTSQATPHVAGTAALMLEKNAALTPADIKAIMMATAVNIGATADEMGAGRIDAVAAVNAA